MSVRTSSGRTAPRPALVLAVLLLAVAVAAPACGGGDNARPAAPAAGLEELVAEQRSQPVDRAAVADRTDIAAEAKERWRWATPDNGALGLPSTDHAGVVLTHSGSHLVAVDPQGTLSWSVAHQALRPVEPLLVNGSVVAAGEDDVVAVARSTGELRWRTPIGHERANAPAADGDTVFVTTWEGRLLALELATGVVRWSVTLEGPSLWRPAAIGTTVIAAWDGGWGGFDVASGRPVWSEELWPDGTGSPAVLTVRGDPVALIASGGRVDANDAKTGKPRWRTTTWVDTAIDQSVTVVGGHVAVPDRQGGVTVLDAATGALQWFLEGGRGDVAERGAVAALSDGLLAFALDVGGLRLSWPGGKLDVDPGALVAGVAPLGAGLVASTWHSDAPALVAFEVLTGPTKR